MPKTITSGMNTHLDLTVTTLATMWRLTRVDGTEFFFTDHDRNLTFEGDIYKASTGFNRSAISNNSTLGVDNLDIESIFDSADILEVDLRGGKFDKAEVRIFVVNWATLADGSISMRRGWLGEVVMTELDFFKTELRGMTQVLSQQIGELYQVECRVDLTDTKCGIPILPDVRLNDTDYVAANAQGPADFIRVNTAGGDGHEAYENRVYECTIAGTTASTPPTYDTTIGNTTVDGTATFTARDAFMRDATVDSVTSQEEFTINNFSDARAVDDWFNGGAVYWMIGNNEGLAMEIRNWVSSSSTITLFLPMGFTITSGDKIRLYPGCDKRLETCLDKFNNVVNFRAEPHIPGIDALLGTIN